MRPAIFVSYSHVDSDLVGPVVALLRASEALVFRDADQLQPGKKWRDQLDRAVSESRILVVFWCSHSCSSEEVKKEYTTAIEKQKDVLPLLIDDTPLPAKLAEYQFIDFRAAFPHGHAAERPSPAAQSPPPQRRAGALWWISGLLVLLVLMVVGNLWLPKAPGSDPFSGGAPAALGVVPWLLALFVVLLVFWAAGKRRRGRDIRYSEAPSPGGTSLTEQQLQLATTIEHELLKRTGKANGAAPL